MRFINIDDSTVTIEMLPHDCKAIAEAFRGARLNDGLDPVLSEAYEGMFSSAALAGQMQADWGIGDQPTLKTYLKEDGSKHST